MNKKVSIITPAYNSEKFIANAMDSVINQTYNNWEMLIIDDCSTDSTIDIVNEYSRKDDRIKLILQKTNMGAGHARNRAIQLSTGRYIAFLDSDDFWGMDKLSKQMDFIKATQAALVYCHYYIYNQRVNKVTHRIESPLKTTYNKMQRNDYIGFLTLLIDTEKTGKQLMPTIRRRQDWAYKLLLLKKGFDAYGIPEPLAYYRVGNQSLSSNKFKLFKYNFAVFRKVLRYSLVKSFYKMCAFLPFYFIFKLTARKRVN